MNHAVILCSGGLDSVVCAHLVKKKLGYNSIQVLFFNYNQKSLKMERKCSMKCAESIGAEFLELNIKELGEISTSLINIKGKAKKIRMQDLKNTLKESEKWYVPARNTVFLSYALAIADAAYQKSRKALDIFLGFKSEGKEAFRDTTEKYIKKFNILAKEAIGAFVSIKAPLIKKDKEDIIILGESLSVDFKNTFSCYLGEKEHCGYCLACKLRQAGFYWAGLPDSTKYNIK